MYVLRVKSLSTSTTSFLVNSDLNLQSQLQKQTQRYDTVDFTSKSCCACGGGEAQLLVDVLTRRNSEGYTCSDISVFRSYGYEELCSTSYDTIDFTASEICLVCGGQLIQDTWYDTQEVQAVTGVCDDSMYDHVLDVMGRPG